MWEKNSYPCIVDNCSCVQNDGLQRAIKRTSFCVVMTPLLPTFEAGQ